MKTNIFVGNNEFESLMCASQKDQNVGICNILLFWIFANIISSEVICNFKEIIEISSGGTVSLTFELAT